VANGLRFLHLTYQKGFINGPLRGDVSKMSFSIATEWRSSFKGYFDTSIEKLKQERGRNQAIAEADPLGVDAAIQALPTLNDRGDIAAIRDVTELAVSRIQDSMRSDFVYASAAIRDICMFGASLTRFGVEPSDCVSGFSKALLGLTAGAEATLPRDSFVDYTSRNPDGDRERRFSSQPEEEIFIDSLRQGMACLDYCLEDLVLAYSCSFAEEAFATHCYAAADSFQTMIDGMVVVKKKVTPEVFTYVIRPFFEPFTVDGEAYSAPSGAEMSILNVDMILWGLECKDAIYEKYVKANMLRLPIIYQELSRQFDGFPSMMSRVQKRFLQNEPLSDNEYNSIRALYHFLTKIYSFRMPHYKVAEENVKLRLKATGGAEVKGSGGFGIDEVKYVLDQTIKSRQVLSQLLPGVSARR
jgi:hypothetical protein